jgi:hypothetical protein
MIVSKDLTRSQAIKKLWDLGDLSYQLKGVQKEMRESVYKSKGRRTIFLCSRRLGKSYTLSLIATEYCLRIPNCIVKYLCPKKKDAKTIIKPIMNMILKDCPVHLKPEWKEADKIYVFPNGSQIQIGGTDGGSAESLRGGYANVAILDEAGFHDYAEFSYIVQSIIMPTLLTTKGKIVMASTPSKEPDHPFMMDYVIPARAEDSIIEYDIYSNPLITQEDIDEIADEYPGGKEDPSFLREFMLRSDVVSDTVVIPEFTKDLQRDIIRQNEIPAYYDAYVSGDPAVVDLTGILFAFYDFLRGKLIIVDELVMGGEGFSDITTQDIADGIRRKESMYFRNKITNEFQEPYLRVMDNNFKILINDLFYEHGLSFLPTAKDNKEAQINKVRLMLRRGEIEIDPKCKNLIHHITTARWDKNRKSFQRVRGSSDRSVRPHHADLLDALIYLARNVDFHRNPYPNGYFELSGEDVFIPASVRNNHNQQAKDFMNSVMNIKKKEK